MSYADTRDSEQLRILKVRIGEFIARYPTHNPPGGRRRTLFFFPGGMGGQLLRADLPYQDNGGPNQTFNYDTVWLSPWTFVPFHPLNALSMEMHKDPRDPPGVERDLNDQIIIADDVVDFLGITPYNQFTTWCDQQNLDWFIFGWDWRRRLEDTVSFFLTQFLPLFRSQVHANFGVDPLADFVLVGHSFGGMVVNLILRQYSSLLTTMTRAITVAAPFYGYDGQIHRWFEGDAYLNWALGRDEVIRVISSLPACYTLLYLDDATYNANAAALQGDPDYPLPDYPSHDAANPAQRVDPYNPGLSRYPGNTGFDPVELQRGLHTMQHLTAPVPWQQAGKFFNIRGVQSASDDTTRDITWQLLQGAGNPPNSPIADQPAHPPRAPGDGVQPAWSTRHVMLPRQQWINVKGNIDHMCMMEHRRTHRAIAKALR